MTRSKIFIRCSIALFVFSVTNSFATAQTIDINPTDGGWYDETGYHDPANQNYVVGDTRSSDCSACRGDYRNFFVFELSGVTQQIASAKLVLTVGRFESADATETYELHDVSTSLGPLLNGTGGVAAHTDLGSGIVYGSGEIAGGIFATLIEVPLNSSAIAAMNANDRIFAIGGSITSLDGASNLEFAFLLAGLPTDTAQLRLTLVPEPSALLLFAIGAISLLGRRKARSHG